MKSSNAGCVSSPRARASSNPFSSDSMSLNRAICSGVTSRIPWASCRKYEPSTCSLTCSRSSSNSRCASGSMNRYSLSSPICPGTSGGSASRKVSRILASSLGSNDNRERSRSTISSSRSFNSSKRTRQVEALLLLVPPLLQATAQRIQPGEPALHPTTHQATEGRLGRVAHQDVVGELLEQVRGRHVVRERILRSVPARIPEARHPSSLGAAAASVAGRDHARPRPVINARPASPKQMNAAAANTTHGCESLPPPPPGSSRAIECAIAKITIGPKP